MQRTTKHDAKPKPDEAQAKPDVEQLRLELMRKVARMANDRNWPSCRRPACQRHRYCAAPDFRCANAPPALTLTPDQEAAARAQLFRALQRRLAELGSQGK